MSDRDIQKLLGYHIFIYPFEKENLKASSYNLTASRYAFIKEKDENGEEKQKLIVYRNKIIIPAHKTAIIETRESIYVTNRITGTYHSKVKLVNKGLGHIGTTLDPCFWGVSAIALNNTTNDPIIINVGEPIVTIMFYSLKSKSSGIHDNMPARVDDNINLNSEDFFEFTEDRYEGIDLNYNEEDCENCINKNTCVDNLENREIYCKKRILKEIRDWKNKDYFLSKESLIKRVKQKVKEDNIGRDIFLYSILTLVLGILLIGIFILLIWSDKFCKELNDTFRTIIAITIPTVVAVIGIIANYKTKNKGEI